MKDKLLFLFVLSALFLSSCGDDEVSPPLQGDKQTPKPHVATPEFNAQNAYDFIQKQVDFGPRVPGSEGHRSCGNWLVEKMKNYGADVITQEAQVMAYDGTYLPMKNIIAQFQPTNKRRILLYAHWDTRPFADKDTLRMKEPIDGANDGGSGVGVLLEVARQIQQKQPDYGIDIILFDAEDYGKPEWMPSDGDPSDWCLGSQYWARNRHKPNYRAKFGILLDMVGAKDAVFNREGTSVALAPGVVDKVWNTAQSLGYDTLFVDEVTGQTIDDNYFVNMGAGIPSANIVHYHVSGPRAMGYGYFHHTHADNMNVIDSTVLKAVGQTVLEVIYQE
jgi:glutaminyl-peptide cyclotransferase